MKKYFVTSDIHGFYDEFIASLDKAGFNIINPNQNVYSCGAVGGLFGSAENLTLPSASVLQVKNIEFAFDSDANYIGTNYIGGLIGRVNNVLKLSPELSSCYLKSETPSFELSMSDGSDLPDSLQATLVLKTDDTQTGTATINGSNLKLSVSTAGTYELKINELISILLWC